MPEFKSSPTISSISNVTQTYKNNTYFEHNLFMKADHWIAELKINWTVSNWLPSGIFK